MANSVAETVIGAVVLAAAAGFVIYAGETRALRMYLFQSCSGFECLTSDTTCAADSDGVSPTCMSVHVEPATYTQDPAPIEPASECGGSCWHECEGAAICETPVELEFSQVAKL